MRDLHDLGLIPCAGMAVPPPTTRQLALVERLVGSPLPESYIAFQRFCNGCVPEWNWFKVETPWGWEEYIVAGFYTISTESADAEDPDEVVWQYLHRGEEVPHGIMPIGLTSLGDLIYLDLTNDGNGRVVLAQHGLPAWASGKFPANTDLVIYVAPSFEAFLALLHEPPEEE
jgi:hypothetical protein